MKNLVQLEMTEAEGEFAEKIAKRLGYTQTAYTTSSELSGLFCLPDRDSQKSGCIVKTANLGFVFVSDLEDLNMDDLWNEQKKFDKSAK